MATFLWQKKSWFPDLSIFWLSCQKKYFGSEWYTGAQTGSQQNTQKLNKLSEIEKWKLKINKSNQINLRRENSYKNSKRWWTKSIVKMLWILWFSSILVVFVHFQCYKYKCLHFSRLVSSVKCAENMVSTDSLWPLNFLKI